MPSITITKLLYSAIKRMEFPQVSWCMGHDGASPFRSVKASFSFLNPAPTSAWHTLVIVQPSGTKLLHVWWMLRMSAQADPEWWQDTQLRHAAGRPTQHSWGVKSLRRLPACRKCCALLGKLQFWRLIARICLPQHILWFHNHVREWAVSLMENRYSLKSTGQLDA